MFFLFILYFFYMNVAAGNCWQIEVFFATHSNHTLDTHFVSMSLIGHSFVLYGHSVI